MTPRPVFRDGDLSIIRGGGRRRLGALILLLAGVWGAAGPAAAQTEPPAASEVAARAERFRQCPVAGVQIQYEPMESDEPVVPELRRVRPVEVWAGSPQWRPVPPLSDYVLLYPRAWTPLDSLMPAHEDLRRRAGRPLPTGAGRILLLEVINRFTIAVASVAAVRGEDGLWRIDRVEEFDAGSDAPTFQSSTWALPPGDGARLDGLLADPCLEAEPLHTAALTRFHVPNAYWLMEMAERDPPIRIGAADEGFGRAGAIRYLILTPRQDTR